MALGVDAPDVPVFGGVAADLRMIFLQMNVCPAMTGTGAGLAEAVY